MANTIKIKRSGTANTAPTSLEHGELALNYADGKLYYKNSSNVISTVGSSGSAITVSDTIPASANTGDLWYESDTGKTFIYYDSFWVEMTGEGGQSSYGNIINTDTNTKATLYVGSVDPSINYTLNSGDIWIEPS